MITKNQILTTSILFAGIVNSALSVIEKRHLHAVIYGILGIIFLDVFVSRITDKE